MADRVARAVRIREPGGPEVLELAEVPVREPGTGELLVRVASSGINRADLLQRMGKYPAPAGWPTDIPGLEYVGTVEATGGGTRIFREGDRVMGIVGGGGYSDFVVVNEREAVRVPGVLSLEQAGAVPEVFLTAYDALFSQMNLRMGETVLIHAVGSGVGTAGLQLAKAAGARVIGTSRTLDKLQRAGELGLDVGVLAVDDGWSAAVRTATGGRGVDVVLDLVGGPYTAGTLAALAERGRWIVVGVTGGAGAPFDFRALMGKRASVTGTVLRARPAEEKMALAREFDARVVQLFERGVVQPVLDKTFRPEEAGEAHRLLESNQTFGKLTIGWS